MSSSSPPQEPENGEDYFFDDPDENGASKSLTEKKSAAADIPKSQWLRSTRALYPLAGGMDGVERDWNGMSRRVWLVSRLSAGIILGALLFGWPLGDLLAHIERFGSLEGWSIIAAYPASVLLFALVVPVLMVFAGYLLSKAIIANQAAEDMATAARQYTEPDQVALQEVETVGAAVRTQMDGLNEGLNSALMRLANVEAMIRKHVDAIETAGAAIETRTSTTMDRVAEERSRLIGLTEDLNKQAEGFAAAITERAEASVAALKQANTNAEEAETNFDTRLDDLEKAANTAVNSFQQLVEALGTSQEETLANAGGIEDAAKRAQEASERAQAATKAAREAASLASEETMRQAAAVANRETISSAISETQDTAREEALAIARGEAEKIARMAVESAGSEIEAIARKAGESLEAEARRAREQTEAAQAMADERKQELSRTHEILARENERLEKLIEEQQLRAERLSTAIAGQSEKLTQLAEQRTALNEQLQAELSRSGAQAIQEGVTEESRLRLSGVDEANQEPKSGIVASEHSESHPFNEEVHETRQVSDVGSVTSPREDLQRLNELARDLAESRASRSRSKHAEDVSGVMGGSPIGKAGNSVNKQEEANASSPQSGQVSIGAADSSVEDTTPVKPSNPGLRSNGAPSWKEILAAADGDATVTLQSTLDVPPLEVGNKPSTDEPLTLRGMSASMLDDPEFNDIKDQSIRTIGQLQRFTLNLDAKLYGEVPEGLLERFRQGDRNVFANRLLRLNEADLKRRIRTECARDKNFEKDVGKFLSEFDGLLEEAAKSHSVDEELREYLGSPLGRMYLLLGEIIGYFA